MKNLTNTCASILLVSFTLGCSERRLIQTDHATETQFQTERNQRAHADPKRSRWDIEDLVQVLWTIQDPSTSEQAVNRAFERLDQFPIVETPEYWVKIVNNPKTTEKHQRHCLYELFRRHFSGNVPLRKLRGL